MKILFVCHRVPFPPNRGGKIRPFHMIQHLGRKHSVVVASLAHTEQELSEARPLGEHCERVIAEVLPNWTRWMQAAAALPSRTPSSVTYFSSQPLSKRIQEAFRKESFDAIIVHCAFAAQYVRNLRCGFRMLDYGDVDSGKWFDYARDRAFPLSVGYRIEAMKLRRYERQLAAEFDLCTATTMGELEEVRELNAGVPSAVIPNGVDLSYFHPRPENPKDSAVLAFLGRMDYFPNIDGTLYFARHIFPLIRRSVPQAEFRIIGSNPSREIQNLAKLPGISVTGHVADVRPCLMDAAIAVAPLRIARGTQNKILEFLAMGVPVVTTPEAAKGVSAKAGQHFLVADGPQAFAEQVVRFLQDPQLRESFSLAGRLPLADAHSWPNSMRILDELLETARPAWKNSSPRSDRKKSMRSSVEG
jgi:sugar transferase (PEP-CTERM/EpsH1 system associated)